MRSSWVIAIYIMGYAVWQLSGWGSPGDRVVIGDVLMTSFNVGAALLIWRESRRRGAPVRVRSAWRLIAIGLTFYCAGNFLQAYYEIVAASRPYPSLADPAFLMFYPFAIAGLLRFPRSKQSAVQSIHALVDCATVAIAGSAVVWYVVLGPATLAEGTHLQTLVTIAFPVADLVLIAALATVLLRRTVPESVAALRLVGVGFVCFVVADLIYGSLSLSGAYSGGHPVDGLYMVAAGLVAIAACRQRAEGAPGELVEAPPVRRTSWVPWLGVALVFCLLLFEGRHDELAPMGGLLASAAAITLLVAVRQMLGQRELVATHAELEQAHSELAAVSITDPVTLLPNHRGMVTAINQAVARSRRCERSCAVVFIDIDHFKRFNDTYGHAAGDAALREFGALAATSLRTADTIGRWGGEEFVLVLDDVDAAGAVQVAERLRATVADHPLRAASGARVTCSVGVAVYPSDGLTRADLINAADGAMYAAKRLGRNRVLAAGDPMVPAAAAGPEVATLLEERNPPGQAQVPGSRVTELAGRVAVELGCDQAEQARVSLAGRLYALGKGSTPEGMMASHPSVVAEVLDGIPGLRATAPLVRGHRERWDGAGYPDGLAGEDIPLGARIIGAADAFDAMLRERPYRRAMNVPEALEELRRRAGTQFDERVVEVIARTARPSSDAPFMEQTTVHVPRT
jgi:two-component system cell cycle response regulator